MPRVAVGEKTDASRKKELKQIEAYKALVDNVQAKVPNIDRSATWQSLTTCPD